MIKFTPWYRCERLLYPEETTSKDDYRFGEIKSYPPQEKTLKKRLPPLNPRTHWSPPSLPFNLYHKNKEILQTHPKDVLNKYVKPPDSGKEHAIKTRPRLILEPAVSMDDIEDPKAREILIEDIYTSETSKRLKEAVRPYTKVQAPVPSLPAVANPISLPKIMIPYVSPEWRMETVTWDQKQLKSSYDSTKGFFQARPPFPCKSCEEAEIVAAHNKRMCQLNSGRHLQRR